MSAPLDARIFAWRDDIAAADLRGKVTARKFVQGKPFMACASVAAMRAAPDPNAAQVSELLFGESFQVYARENGWCWGQALHDDYVGYIAADDLTAAAPATHRVTALRSFIFSRADIKSPPLRALSMGARLAVTAHEGRFCALASGGFAIAEHIGALADTADDYVARALMFCHVPYLWGGRSSLGIDCSGLVQVALMAAGVSCPRDSDLQMAALGEACAGAPLRGDIVFWHGHVGILTARDRLLHANATDMCVREEDFATACARIETAILCRKRLR